VWKIPAGGGQAVQVTTEGGIAAVEAPGGRDLFYVKGNTPGIWRRPVGGGPEVLVVEALQPYDWGNWAVSEGGIYFVRRDAPSAVLVLYRLPSGGEAVMVPLDRLPRHPGLAVSSDGQDLFFTRVDRTEGDILLVEDFE
jgi:hypothetical protein